jgi:hypothetical protein
VPVVAPSHHIWWTPILAEHIQDLAVARRLAQPVRPNEDAITESRTKV